MENGQERCTRAVLHVVELDLGRELNELKASRGDVDDREVRVDAIDDPWTSEREGTCFDQFGFSGPRGVLSDHANRLHTGDEVHGTTDSGNRVRTPGGPVGQVAGCGNLKSAEDAKIDVTTTNHRHESSQSCPHGENRTLP